MLKRFFILIICLIMVVLLCSCSAQQKIDDFSYKVLDDGSLMITGYKGNANSITIPDAIDGKTVTHIGSNCFGLTSSVTNVVIPDTVISIDDSAFDCATKLNSVTIKAKTISIGNRAFTASGVSNIKIDCEEIVIGADAFKLCNKLNSFNISLAKKIKIGSEAFLGTALKSIELSANEIDIGASAFRAVGDLNKAVIKCETLELGEEAFHMSTHFASFSAAGLNEDVSLKSSSIADKCFSCCDLTMFMIQGGNVIMGDEVFYNNGHLTEITVPKGTIFGKDVFKSCYKNPNVKYTE